MSNADFGARLRTATFLRYGLSVLSVAISSSVTLLLQVYAVSTALVVPAICRSGIGQLPARLGQRVFRPVRPFVFACICVLALLAEQACQKADKHRAGIVLTLIDQSWVDKESRDRLNEELRLFTNESGIRVELLPGPESAVEQLATWRKLLEGGATGPDVYAVDVIWPGILADELLDLNSYIPVHEIAAHFPELIANNTVNGRLVALPSNMNAGMLFYRADLLQQYGYRAPPKTWDELESMAARIQAGERANGNKDFWGFVWQGAPSEALTCNALEWQVSEGGGTILENGTITVNNPQTIRAWERAARWVGSISPPGVVAYREWDASNIWQAGKAAFMRNWASAYVAAHAPGSPIRETFEVARLPEGRAGLGATLGGNGYGVSRHSLHPREAAMLVRYLCRRDVQLRRCRKTGQPTTLPELYSDTEVLAANPYFSNVLEMRKDITLRPAAVSGKMYPDVSRAYFEAVHEVLTGKKTAARAAADLQGELQEITGLKSASTGVGDLSGRYAAPAPR
jgi:trehalose/maltose transport system substrate-binding protein